MSVGVYVWYDGEGFFYSILAFIRVLYITQSWLLIFLSNGFTQIEFYLYQIL